MQQIHITLLLIGLSAILADGRISHAPSLEMVYNSEQAVAHINASELPGFASHDSITVGHFSEHTAGGRIPDYWERLAFHNIDKETEYLLVDDEGVTVVKAASKGGASGLIREVDIDPAEYPILSWRWKVEQIIEQSDWRRKKGDDYPARIYLIFEHDPAKLTLFDRVVYRALRLFGYRDIPTRALNYIWATQGEQGNVVPNPFTNWVQMVLAQTGARYANQWVDERHNVLEDYRRAFGEEPSRIRGVAIMTDTDNTESAAEAYYGDIVFHKAP